MENYDLLEADFEEDVLEKFTVIILYDISNDKKRARLIKILNSFGFRIQKSVFECLLSRNKYKKLIIKLDKFIKQEKNEEDDSIIVYRLNKNVITKVYGTKIELKDEICYFI